MIHDMIKLQLVASVPFARLANVEVVELGDGNAVTRIGEQQELRNHVGTQHAAALFLAGETASGAASAGAFAPMIADVRLVPRTAEITYIKGATTAVTATAQVEGSAEELRGLVSRNGKTEFVVNVAFADSAGESIATMRLNWHASQRT